MSLFHHITVPVLSEAFYSLKSDVAAGVDGVTWEMYAEGLGDRLTDLHGRLHRGGAYRAPPVRRVEIPKPDGGKRPLGIATLEDKIVQKAVTDTILVPIYESEFLGFNYGFRPGRGAHNALDALTVGIERCKINWVLDADVRILRHCEPGLARSVSGTSYRGQACDSSHIQVVERWSHGRDRLDGHGQGRTAGGSGVTCFMVTLP